MILFEVSFATVYGISSKLLFYKFIDQNGVNCIEMNNGEVGGSRGRGRGWQHPDNKPSKLRRPKSLADDTKGTVFL